MLSTLTRVTAGSSPHARGTPAAHLVLHNRGRFIPACAGNAQFPRRAVRCVAVHPRMRGERLPPLPAAPGRTGSSPHARGTRVSNGRCSRVPRFIPACAGNAQPDTRPSTGSAVHPRMRGERKLTKLPPEKAAGSSPHARGTHEPGSREQTTFRFIPACAGNALPPLLAALGRTVHPRMRGERAHRYLGIVMPIGSSPHARGTPRGARADGRPGRFIPACAGNAGYGRRRGTCGTVHPRMRGERCVRASAILSASGSSPHARGTHFQ